MHMRLAGPDIIHRHTVCTMAFSITKLGGGGRGDGGLAGGEEVGGGCAEDRHGRAGRRRSFSVAVDLASSGFAALAFGKLPFS
jgi:hypothetical protein